MGFNLSGRYSKALAADSASNPIYQYQDEGYNLIATGETVVGPSAVSRVGVIGGLTKSGDQLTGSSSVLPDIILRGGWYSIYNNSSASVVVSVISNNAYVAGVLQPLAHSISIPAGGTVVGDFTSINLVTAASTVVAYRKLV